LGFYPTRTRISNHENKGKKGNDSDPEDPNS